MGDIYIHNETGQRYEFARFVEVKVNGSWLLGVAYRPAHRLARPEDGDPLFVRTWDEFAVRFTREGCRAEP